MKLTRVVRMGPKKLASRVWQEELKWLERMRIVDSGAREPEELCENVVVGPSAEAIRTHAQRGELEAAAKLLLDRFRATAPSRFFAGTADARTPALISELMPEARAAVLAAAAKSRKGRFDLLGYSDLEFGEPIDWQLEPLARKKAPLAHWTRIDPLDRASVGDHKLVWELNRHQWLLHSAEAYAFTRDERYAELCVHTLERWIRDNPPGRGINWASSLELAFRMIAWCWTLVLVRESRALAPLAFVRVLGAIHAHATHIARYLSTTFSPNTHLLGEALGLFYAGVLFEECDGAPRWRALARNVLCDEIARQVKRDGVYFEQSTCYQRYAIEMYMHFLILAERNAVDVPARVAERVEGCLEFLLAMRRAEGRVPQIGDGDGGWLLPLVPREADDMRGTFAIAAALFDRKDCAVAASAPTLELAWLLGPRGVQTFSKNAQASLSRATPAGASRLFKDGGYAVLRSDDGPRAHQLVFDVGPLGCPISGAHGHADLLAISCDVFGEPCIVDPGMPQYGGDPAWRDAFRSTALHSSVIVDGSSQAAPSGPFAWQRRPAARLLSWTSGRDYDIVAGEHDAYRTKKSPLTHRRRVIFVKPRYFVVIDELEAGADTSPHHVELCFQFAPRVSLRMELPWVRAITPRGHALLVHASADVILDPAIHEGERPPLPIRGWFSSGYGKLEPAPALTFATKIALPLRVVTVLLPLEAAQSAAPEVFPPLADRPLLERLS